jgi:hypothetical protein
MLEGCADQNIIKCKVFFAICEEAGTDLTAVLDVQDKPKTSIGMWTFFIAGPSPMQACSLGVFTEHSNSIHNIRSEKGKKQ